MVIGRMRHLYLASALVALGFASPALAGFDKTKWGMSPAEVEKATGGRAAVSTGESGDRFPGGVPQVGNVGQFSFAGASYRTLFYYRADRLEQVRMRVGNEGCGELASRITAQQGAPSQHMDADWNEVTEWKDSAHGNRILLVNVAGACSIQFRPL